jgi:hypothetical protein
MFSLKIELQNVVVLNMSITCWTWQFWVEYFAETGGDHMTCVLTRGNKLEIKKQLTFEFKKAANTFGMKGFHSIRFTHSFKFF